MDTITAGFVDGIRLGADTSGVLSQLQGRIFALLYLTTEQLSLTRSADELQQSKSKSPSISHGLVEWPSASGALRRALRKGHIRSGHQFWLRDA